MNKFLLIIITLGVILLQSCSVKYYTPDGMDEKGFFVYKDSCIDNTKTVEYNVILKMPAIKYDCIKFVKVKYYPNIDNIDPKVVEDFYKWRMCITNSDGTDLECQECDILYNHLGIFQY